MDRRSGCSDAASPSAGRSARMGVNLPDSDISAPAITARDRECVEWAVAQGLDPALVQRRGRRDAQLKMLRTAAARWARPPRATAVANQPIPVIAKIEKPQAVESIDEILSVADGVMVARGDLASNSTSRRCRSCRALISMAQEHGKPCVVATQMLGVDDRQGHAHPRRGQRRRQRDLRRRRRRDASGETAVGRHPALVVETMRRTLAAEEEIHHGPQMAAPPSRLARSTTPRPPRRTRVAHGQRHQRDHGRGVVADRRDGRVVRRTASACRSRRTRPTRPPSGRMALLRGVIPVYCTTLPAHRTEFAAMVDRMALEGWTQPGQAHGAARRHALRQVGRRQHRRAPHRGRTRWPRRAPPRRRHPRRLRRRRDDRSPAPRRPAPATPRSPPRPRPSRPRLQKARLTAPPATYPDRG